MTPTDLRFTVKTAPYAAEILAMSEARPGGAEIYTCQRLAPENDYGLLWAGVDEADRLVAVLMDGGGFRCLLTETAGVVGSAAPDADAPALFAPIPPEERLCVMTKDAPVSAAQPERAVSPSELIGLVHAHAAPNEKEEMYVYWTRAVNAGLSHAFGIRENGSLCAAAQILAKNRRYAQIGNLFTRPDCRGRGFASRLLAACEAQAAKEGLLPVLFCKPEMERYYAARGYRTLNPHEL